MRRRDDVLLLGPGAEQLRGHAHVRHHPSGQLSARDLQRAGKLPVQTKHRYAHLRRRGLPDDADLPGGWNLADLHPSVELHLLGNANRCLHAGNSGQNFILDATDFMNGASGTLTCPESDSIILTHLQKDSTSCTYTATVTSVTWTYTVCQ
jgi:hypothetical protein